MEKTNDIKYVSYKSLFVSLLSLFTIIVVIFGLYIAHSDKKLNREVYDRDYGRLCSDIADIKNTVEVNYGMLNKFQRNQELVLRALKIEPVK